MLYDEVKFEEVSDTFGDYLGKMQAKYGNRTLLKFPTKRDARMYLEREGLDWVSYGLCRNGVEWFQIRPEHASGTRAQRAPSSASATATQRTAPKSRDKGAPTAKSICLGKWKAGIDRDKFVAACVKEGVKEITAKTMFSDIKAGRIK